MLGLACDGDGDDVRVIKASGTLCLRQSGTEIRIDALLDACEGSCNVVRHASCDAELTPAGIVVSSRVEQEDLSDEGDECTTECSPTSAVCVVSVLAEGSVRIAYGAEAISLELPLTEPVSVFGREPNLCALIDANRSATGTAPFTGVRREP